MWGIDVDINDRIEPVRDWRRLNNLQPARHGLIHSHRYRLDDQSLARFEVGVEPAMGQTSEIHQGGNAHSVGALFAQS
jgi:hypothetical protein